MIKFEHVSYRYINAKNVIVHALNDINCVIDDASFTIITGPSGCGKTTFLYALSGLIKIDSGSIIVDKKVIQTLNEKELTIYRNKEIGFIHQNYFLENTLSVLDNVMLPYLISGGSRKEAKEKAIILLEKVGLKDKEKHYPNELSGGEQQRVAIARALINDPKIIIADEPTGNLDSANSKIVMDLLKNEQLSGRTILMVTHDMDMRKYCTKEIKIFDGKII